MIIKIPNILLFSLLLMSFNAFSHDASLHKKEDAEKPHCEAMENMDHSTMEMDDPIMVAMMQQCESVDHHETEDDHHQEESSQ